MTQLLRVVCTKDPTCHKHDALLAIRNSISAGQQKQASYRAMACLCQRQQLDTHNSVLQSRATSWCLVFVDPAKILGTSAHANLLPLLYLSPVCAGLFRLRTAAGRQLLQPYWEQPVNKTIVIDPSNKTVYVNSTAIAPRAEYRVAQGLVNAIAAYPNPQTDNPNGWRFKTVSNATLVLGTQFPLTLGRVQSISQSKLAPAVALAGANVEGPGLVAVLARTKAASYPGLQYGATVGQADYRAVSTGPFEPVQKLTNPVLVLMVADVQTGQGQAINLVNVEAEGNNLVVGDSRSETRSGRWYMAPGNAIMGQRFKLKGAQTAVFSRNRARASIGSATSGVLHVLDATGNIPGMNIRGNLRRNSYFLTDSGGIARVDNKANTDIGAAQAGNLQLVHSAFGDSTMVGLAQARTAEGNAIAGGLNIGYTEQGDVYEGDYWEELSNPGNAVVATNYGRGTSQAGQMNIAFAPNRDVRIGGTVAATALQGSATAGAFDLGNAYGEVEIDQDVTAVTSEYTATAGAVAVGVASQRSAVVTNSVSKTDAGPALSYGISSAVVGQQNSAIASATSSTATGQAAAVGASQAVGGVASETQAASLAKTTTGNALSVGSSVSGAALQGRAVSTATGVTTEGNSLATGWAGVVSADSDASAAASGVSGTGNAAAAAQAYGLGVLEGKATTASSSGTTAGSTGSLSLAVSTGLIQAQSTAASSGQTRDGNVQSLAGSLAAGGVNAVSRATSSGATSNGDVQSRAQSAAISAFHGEATSQASAATGCADCVSDAVSNAISVGVVADSFAAASASTPVNPGNALANAMAVGLISRTTNGGSSRVAIGPGQALSGGFAVSAPRRVAESAAAALTAVDPAHKATQKVSPTAPTKGSCS